MKTGLQKIAEDPRVNHVEDDSSIGDGYWVYLRDGYADTLHDPFQPRHVIHEYSLREIRESMLDVLGCSCPECCHAIQTN